MKYQIKVTYHDHILFEGAVEGPVSSCRPDCVKVVEFASCGMDGASLNGVDFTEAQVKVIVENAPEERRLGLAYDFAPGSWSYQMCRNWLKVNDIAFEE